MKFKFLINSAFLLLVALYGCSGIKVDQKINISQGDWVMSGGSPDQQNVSAYSLAPPLALVWEYNIEGGVGPAGICAVDAVLFVNALQGELFTFDIATGGKIGNIKFLGKDVSTAPLVMGNDVILSYAGDNKYSLASYSLSRGEINWRKNYAYVQTSPVLKDNFIYFGNLKGSQYKVEAATGIMVWKFDSKSPIHSTCAGWEDNVIFGNDKGGIYCLNTENGSQKWKVEISAPVYSSPMIDNGMAYLGCDDSNYYCINISDGNVLWKNNLKTKIISGSALYEKKNIIISCVDGSVYSLNAATGSIEWKFSSRGAVTSAPVVSGSYIYFASYDSFVYCLNAVNGDLVWSHRLDNKSRTSPIVWKDYLFAAADDIVYCFTNKPVTNNNSEKKN
jgi:outer membrane protein assembly factor BamB